MLPKIEKARQIRASMAQQAQNILSDEPEVNVCFYFLTLCAQTCYKIYVSHHHTHKHTHTACIHKRYILSIYVIYH